MRKLRINGMLKAHMLDGLNACELPLTRERGFLGICALYTIAMVHLQDARKDLLDDLASAVLSCVGDTRLQMDQIFPSVNTSPVARNAGLDTITGRAGIDLAFSTIIPEDAELFASRSDGPLGLPAAAALVFFQRLAGPDAEPTGFLPLTIVMQNYLARLNQLNL